jgi:PAS domain S-box-containing protein
MENSPILAWITDGNGKIKYLNPAYLKTYHLKKEDIGKSVFEVFPQSIAQQICENNELVQQTSQPVKTIETGITPDEREHIYQVVKFPVASDNKVYIGGWAIDLTEEIRLREHLRTSLKRLQQSEKDLRESLVKEHHLNNLKSRFVSMASHEFRSPLSTMLSSIFLLEKYSTSEQQPHRLKHIYKIKESIHHMNALLEDFLSLGKLDESKTTMVCSHFDLKELIHDVIEEIEPIRRQGQNLHFDAGELKNISSDKKLLRNIIANLLSNACKFSDENKNIWIITERLDKEIKITVKDEGIGICKEDQKHLFETFFRGQNVQNIQGTGLGLHIIKRLTELLQGRVQLKSELGKGTTVSVFLPAAY